MKDKKPFEQGPVDGLTPELMEGYAKGSLSPEMMARIKQYLNENPFEAEAMEGLIANPVEFANDIQDLEDRLKHKITFTNSNIRKAFWPAAAVVALLILSGLVFYFFIPESNESSELAVNEDKVEEKSQPEAAITPSNQKTEQVPQNPTITLENNEATSLREVKEPSPEEEIESASQEVVVKKVNPTENSQELTFEPAITEDEESTSIVSSIEVQPLTKQESTVSDNSHQQPLPPNRSFSADGNSQAAAQSKAKRSIAPSAGLEIARDSQEDAVFPEGQTPKNIKSYLKEHLIYPEEAKANKITGKVIIVFIIHEDGTLGNFEFLQKLGYGCEEEAVRALKQGPSWKPVEINEIAVKSRGQIEIAFPQ
jgi:outer membrane biosynthesis protein TonB